MQSRSRRTRGEIASVQWMPLEDAARPDLAMEQLIQALFDRVLEGREPPLRIGLQLHPPAFDHPFVIPMRSPEQNNPRALAAAIERLNEQSGANIDLLAGTTITKVLAVWPRTVDAGDHAGLFFGTFKVHLFYRCM